MTTNTVVSAAINSIINFDSDSENSVNSDGDEKFEESLKNTISVSKLLPSPIAGSISEIVTESQLFESNQSTANNTDGHDRQSSGSTSSNEGNHSPKENDADENLPHIGTREEALS